MIIFTEEEHDFVSTAGGRMNQPASSRLQNDVHLLNLAPMMTTVRTIYLAFLVLLFEACSITEQTPGDVSQKFEEGIKGNGKIVPTDKGQSQTNPSNNSPVTSPAAGTPPQP